MRSASFFLSFFVSGFCWEKKILSYTEEVLLLGQDVKTFPAVPPGLVCKHTLSAHTLICRLLITERPAPTSLQGVCLSGCPQESIRSHTFCCDFTTRSSLEEWGMGLTHLSHRFVLLCSLNHIVPPLSRGLQCFFIVFWEEIFPEISCYQSLGTRGQCWDCFAARAST